MMRRMLLFVLSIALLWQAPLHATTMTQDTKVWVNMKSRVYHCPGTQYYGNTKRGEYMTEGEARAMGMRPAGKTSCSLHPAPDRGPSAQSLLGTAGSSGRKGTTASSKVWVNTSSDVYHCPGTRYYGKTKRGMFMTEDEAKAMGATPAGGNECDR